MCQIILNLSGTLKQEEIRNSFDNNGDSAGISYIEDGKIITKKIIPTNGYYPSMTDHSTLWETYKAAREANPKSPILIHTRISTGGLVDEANCHPFNVSEDMVFAHNGVVYDLSFHKSKYSDTWHLNSILQKMYNGDKNFLKHEAFREMLTSFIGHGNKLAFIMADGSWDLFNEAAGNWNKEMTTWFSNNSHCQWNDYVWSGNTKVYRNGGKGKGKKHTAGFLNAGKDSTTGTDSASGGNPYDYDTMDDTIYTPSASYNSLIADYGDPQYGFNEKSSAAFYKHLTFFYQLREYFMDMRKSEQVAYFGVLFGKVYAYDPKMYAWFETGISAEFAGYWDTDSKKGLSNVNLAEYTRLYPDGIVEYTYELDQYDPDSLDIIRCSTLYCDLDAEEIKEAIKTAKGEDTKEIINK